MPGRNDTSTAAAAAAAAAATTTTFGRFNYRVKITLPRAWKLQPNPALFTFDSIGDFKLTWNEFLEKYSNNGVYNTLKKEIRNGHQEFWITDNRVGDKKLSWTLDTTVDQFIDSFERTYKTYNATILNSSKLAATARRPQQAQPPTATAPSASASPSSSAARGNLGNGTGETSKTTKRKSNGNEARNADLSPPIRPRFEEDDEITLGQGQRNHNDEELSLDEETSRLPNLPSIKIDHDMCSMAAMAGSTASQDSMSDSITQGVNTNRDIRTKCTYNWIRNLDNATLLRIESELKQAKDSGKWMQSSRHLPETFDLLAVVFELS